MFKIEDFIASYPDPKTPHLQTLLSAKRELNELAPPLSEPLPGRCEFYKAQELFKRLFMNYDEIILMARTGTGKSISMIHGSESIHELVNGVRSAMDALPYINKALFLVKGPILAEEFKQQLVYKGTCAGTYDVDIVLNAQTSRSRRSNITRTIKEWWEVDHFQAFANKLHKMSDKEIIDQYSGTLVFIDEVHYIKDMEIFDSENVVQEVKTPLNSKTGKKKVEFGKIYTEFHRFLHLIKRRKIVLASATLMINTPNELIHTPKELIASLNLINPLDMQLVEDENDRRRGKSFDWNTITLAQLKPYIEGKVSFVRELDTGVNLVYHGTVPNIEFLINDYKGDQLTINFQNTIYFTQMSEFQSISYRKVGGGNYKIDKRNASCFVFPDGSLGGDFDRNTRNINKKNENVVPTSVKKSKRIEKSGIIKYVTSEEKDTFTATPEFSAYLSDYNNIRKSSCKYADILKKYSPSVARKFNSDILPGNVFIYSALKSGSGAFVLGLCLEHHGFSRFVDTSIPIDRYDSMVKKSIDKKLRYAMITGETPNARKDAILELFNHPMNRHGEYIKVLIGNETMQAGISLSNVINFDLIVADWHSAGVYQALSRILRATSHVDLIAEYPGIRIDINIFFHASLAMLSNYIPYDDINTFISSNNFVYDREEKFQGDTKMLYNPDLGIEFDSVDLDLYVTSEDKNHRIKRIERMLVQTAMDAQINAFRNHRETDKSYTETCYYDTCDFQFSDPKPAIGDIYPLTPETQWSNLKDPNLDLSTFDIYYSEALIDHIIELLIELFRNNSIYYVEQILSFPRFADFPEKYLWLAVNKLIMDKTIIYDRFGKPSYLYTTDNKIWISFEYSQDYDTDESQFYSQNYISITSTPFEEYTNSVDTKQKQIAEKLLKHFDEKEWNSLTLFMKIELFEDAYIRFRNNDISPNTMAFIKPFESAKATFRIDPRIVTEIEAEYKKYTETQKKDSFIISDEYKNALLESKNSEPITVHWIYNRSPQRDKYTEAQRLAKIFKDTPIKIYDPNIKAWRKAQPFEHAIFTFLIEHGIEAKLEPFRNQIYQFIDFEGNTRLMDDRPKESRATSGSHKNRGKSSIPREEKILEILYDIGYRDEIPPNISHSNLYKLLQDVLQRNGMIFDFRDLNL
jgi:hypothetical protein